MDHSIDLAEALPDLGERGREPRPVGDVDRERGELRAAGREPFDPGPLIRRRRGSREEGEADRAGGREATRRVLDMVASIRGDRTPALAERGEPGDEPRRLLS